MTLSPTIDYIKEQHYWLYDSETMPFINQFISHFALGDSLLKKIGAQQNSAALHFWTAADLVILGMMDTKLPEFKAGLLRLAEQQQNFLVRNAGGLAVVADQGILNFSLILPELPEHKISIDEGYRYMLRLIQDAFKAYGKTIEAYEITESYCPGAFDLSIAGKKFAGIAQRRMRGGVGIMVYLSVNGSQEQRSKMIQDFYAAGLNGKTTKWTFPQVNPTVMATLEDLLETSLSINEVKDLILASLTANHNHITTGQYDHDIQAEYQLAFTKMIQRNEQMLQENLNKELLL